jgi:hypothetical protein
MCRAQVRMFFKSNSSYIVISIKITMKINILTYQLHENRTRNPINIHSHTVPKS